VLILPCHPMLGSKMTGSDAGTYGEVCERVLTGSVRHIHIKIKLDNRVLGV